MPTIAITIGSRAAAATTQSAMLGDRLDALPQTSARRSAFRWASIAACVSAWCCIRNIAPEVYLEGAISAAGHAVPRTPRAAGRPQRPGAAGRRLRRGMRHASGRTWPSPKASSATTRPGSGSPSPTTPTCRKLTALRDQLKAGLSGCGPGTGPRAAPSVAELAEQIKALKAAHTIEATPERTGKRRLGGGARHRPHPQACPGRDITGVRRGQRAPTRTALPTDIRSSAVAIRAQSGPLNS